MNDLQQDAINELKLSYKKVLTVGSKNKKICQVCGMPKVINIFKRDGKGNVEYIFHECFYK